VDRVAKVRISVIRGGERHYLLSIKRAEGKAKHGRLEFLGGHIDNAEDPLEGLIRELAEEEKTGTLAKRARAVAPDPKSMDVAGAHQYLFELEIDEAEYAHLVPDPEESLGFELVTNSALHSKELRSRLTSRTRQIVEALNRSSP
jgi:hypothetical protein